MRYYPTHKKSRKAILLIDSHPIKEKERAEMTVIFSPECGKTCPVRKLIYGYGAMYSDLVQLKDGAIVLLYEKRNNHPGSDLPGGISFVRFELDWLKGK